MTTTKSKKKTKQKYKILFDLKKLLFENINTETKLIKYIKYYN